MSKREPELLLKDIEESIEKIKVYTKGMSFEMFQNDDKTIDAVIRNFEIIGEAANRIPDEIKDKFTEVNWHRIRGFRNRIVHDYMGVDLEIIWEIIEKNIDELQEQIDEIIRRI
jgi:uncharacterized protein with HEPN domain